MRLSEELLRLSISHIIGYDNKVPLGGVQVVSDTGCAVSNRIASFFFSILDDKDHTSEDNSLENRFLSDYDKVKEVFCSYYDSHEALTESLIEKIQHAKSDEERAQVVTRVWLPELALAEDDMLARWKVHQVEPVEPVDPTRITIQLNALYTLPEQVPGNLDLPLVETWKSLQGNYGKKIADYDHPVPLFEQDDHHELINCLDEMENDLDFEKEMGVLPADHKMIVTLSLSVTHERIDHLCGMWIQTLLKTKSYKHLQVLVLTEEAVNHIKESFFTQDFPVYSVFGKYAMHFNALKYTQLLLEKAYGIIGGFKLDTDEGMRSRDAFQVTGKTWLQLMCHPYWGAKAKDWKGREVTLDINEGEYINSKDIDQHGYAGAVRCPDVKVPGSYISAEIFFNKAFAHGRATALYNTFDSLENGISHTVVKGGGYGILNKGLRKAVPFTYSQVGRAEDQQFYFSGLNGGIRGAFHPDLRIAHYKAAVAQSEHKTMATRFIGDMYRLVIFQELVRLLEVKEEIDPMPGVFAGQLAQCQAFFNLLYKAYTLALSGDETNCQVLVNDGLAELDQLRKDVETGTIEEKLAKEHILWQDFIKQVDAITDHVHVRSVLDLFMI